MFPFVRLAKEMVKARRQLPLGLTDLHVTQHRVWPWDLDGFMELNNGRALTLYDLGRLGLGQRAGLIDVLRANRWGLTMAGSSVRYRRRLHAFQKFEVRSRAVCWDDKFTYLEQSMWKPDGECASHVLYRSAVTDKNGIVPPHKVLEAMNQDPTSPPIPGWIAAWIKAEAQRPWPPMQETDIPSLKSVA
ncbi:acyl-CoA thioesterase [uncultured Tateyamaria sp.]|uniref:acyl-CoA thioesterase n=1 Tax=uncultured Tateyamaria sp. TaxID=455651 RepID=UPI00260DCBDE|nr:acyl-CoA thioesterase [uncultured Tateyamaria sp.]